MVSLAPSTASPIANSKLVGHSTADQTANTFDDSDNVPASQTSLGLRVPAQDVMRATSQALRELRNLPANWDSYGARPPTRVAIDTAQALLSSVYSVLARVPAERLQPELLVPLADGGVQIEWSAHTVSVEVQVGPTGTLGYLYVDRSTPEGRYSERDDAPWAIIFSHIVSVVLVP
jgi:hypothetical protein